MDWTKCDAFIYATEVSDLNAHKELDGKPRNQCPKCNGFFSKKNLIYVKTNDEHEKLYWEFRCPTCRCILKVFND